MKEYTCVRCGKKFNANRKTAVCADCHTAVCVICGKKFELQTPWTQKTCSSKCRGEYRKISGIAQKAASGRKPAQPHVYIKQCKYCGKEFETTSPRQVYCKDVHYGPCPVCGVLVEIKDMSKGPATCSKECKQKLIESTCLAKYGSTNVVNSEHGRNLAKQTCLQKYGVEHYSKTQEYKDKYESTSMAVYGTKHPMQSIEVKQKVANTNIERYGGVSPSASEVVKLKAAQSAQEHHGGFGFASSELLSRIQHTMIETHGAASPMQCAELKEKIAKTNIDKYGVANPLASSSIRAKGKQTSLKRYGTEFPSQSAEVQSRTTDTVNQRFGVNNVFQSAEIQSKIKSTLLNTYDVDNPMKSPEIIEKVKATNLDKYGSEWYNSSKVALERKMTDPSKIEQFITFKSEPAQFIESTFSRSPTLTELSRELGVDIATASKYVINSNSQHLIAYHKSTMEEDVVSFIHQLRPDVQIEQHNRNIIYPQEIDIYLPEYKLGIECNPTVTHNSSVADPWKGEPKSYHYHKDKSKLCINAGIMLFHIFGYEWTHRREIILSMISNMLGANSNRVYARNTRVCEIPHAECMAFLNANHRQGQTFAKIRLGLRDKVTDELVSVMTFNHIRSTIGSSRSDDTWELSRFCSKLHTNVLGGASKLFRYFCDTISPEHIVSFSDVAHTKGALYRTLGFTQVSTIDTIKPGYVWVDYATDDYLNRVQCQKHHLPALFKDDTIDIDNYTEREIMEDHGYVQVFDSGVIRWEWCPSNNSR